MRLKRTQHDRQRERGPHRARQHGLLGFVHTPAVQNEISKAAARIDITDTTVLSDVILGTTAAGEISPENNIAGADVFLAGIPSSALTRQSITLSHGRNICCFAAGEKDNELREL